MSGNDGDHAGRENRPSRVCGAGSKFCAFARSWGKRWIIPRVYVSRIQTAECRAVVAFLVLSLLIRRQCRRQAIRIRDIRDNGSTPATPQPFARFGSLCWFIAVNMPNRAPVSAGFAGFWCFPMFPGVAAPQLRPVALTCTRPPDHRVHGRRECPPPKSVPTFRLVCAPFG